MIIIIVITRLELIWVNRDYTGLDWFLHLLKTAESCPIVNIMVRLLFDIIILNIGIDLSGDWFLHLLKTAESCPIVNIMVRLLFSMRSTSVPYIPTDSFSFFPAVCHPSSLILSLLLLLLLLLLLFIKFIPSFSSCMSPKVPPQSRLRLSPLHWRSRYLYPCIQVSRYH